MEPPPPAVILAGPNAKSVGCCLHLQVILLRVRHSALKEKAVRLLGHYFYDHMLRVPSTSMGANVSLPSRANQTQQTKQWEIQHASQTKQWARAFRFQAARSFACDRGRSLENVGKLCL
jgi:hypothetical protein